MLLVLAVKTLVLGGCMLPIAFGALGTGILFAGYSSNSKYSLLGTLRAIGQKISYSIVLSLAIIICMLSVGTVDYLS